ncbi:MAG: thioredoxin family protein [Rhizobiales bacterium]|nr:thioredoxin family protein [Rhizobacter sp.]
MSEALDPARPVLVACLCAAWCRTCNDYRLTFDALAREFAHQARFVWVDIEDDEDALGGVDVVDFPTLLVAQGDRIPFFGPVLPHAQTARHLLQRALRGELGAVTDAGLAGLPARLRALG